MLKWSPTEQTTTAEDIMIKVHILDKEKIRKYYPACISINILNQKYIKKNQTNYECSPICPFYETLANGEESDQTPQNVASEQVHTICLQNVLLKISMKLILTCTTQQPLK